MNDETLIHRDAKLNIYYAPFDDINPAARIFILGISPGFQQVEASWRNFRNHLQSGADFNTAMFQAKSAAAFVGTTRKNLISMMNDLLLPDLLGISSIADLFGARSELLHASSAIRYPVFMADGTDYTGHQPQPLKHVVLREFLLETLVAELSQVQRALVIPLGKSVNEALGFLAAKGLCR